MGRKHNDASKRFHDRVAAKYDQIYDDPYWDFHDRVTWAHIKPHLPKNTAAAVMDVGCGTGKWGLRLLKAGYATTFSDLSTGMLNVVREKLQEWAQRPDLAAKVAKAAVVEADITNLRALEAEQFELVLGMGDVVSICSDPAQALSEIHRVTKPGGVFVFTVDNALAALDHFVESGNLEALANFVRTGGTHWLTNNVSEQFNVTMFTPTEAEALCRARGFEVISRIGKTVLPVRQNKKFFEKDGSIETMVDLEARLAKDPAAVGRASHIQIAARRQ